MNAFNTREKFSLLTDYKRCSSCSQIMFVQHFLSRDYYFYCQICQDWTRWTQGTLLHSRGGKIWEKKGLKSGSPRFQKILGFQKKIGVEKKRLQFFKNDYYFFKMTIIFLFRLLD